MKSTWGLTVLLTYQLIFRKEVKGVKHLLQDILGSSSRSCCSVARSCPTLCHPLDCRTSTSLSFTTLGFVQTHVQELCFFNFVFSFICLLVFSHTQLVVSNTMVVNHQGPKYKEFMQAQSAAKITT